MINSSPKVKKIYLRSKFRLWASILSTVYTGPRLTKQRLLCDAGEPLGGHASRPEERPNLDTTDCTPTCRNSKRPILKMPRNLPGFYFDDEKQRYFPISSKPTSKPIVMKPDPPNNSIEPPNSKPSPSGQQNLKRKWESISSNSMDNMRRSINPTQNQQFMQFVRIY